ncbi:PIG-L deacetylase family protein [Modestobacter roseus]|uniref:LmbE family N-acetylglucosaminyl deacetylase n=1 Tax=Modestobacter roseus TaxID=1181884 RepID=A0A562IWM2_9ACTN|nr:PIG-L deacetylase family protein [Modestobacter roseus]MQA34008.1 LmbE family protein [Modestobacter roseus]TWH75367.1 LmbE family N-acetylglucosaminyl deacetylase [Modestobacter roseus]
MLALVPANGRPLRLALLGAHCDDVEIGCGGVLLDLADRGALDRVDVLVATSTPAREAECRASLAGFLGTAPHAVRFGGLPDGRLPGHWDAIKTLLDAFARDTRPDVVFAPSPQDAHQDHRLLGELVRTAFRDHLVLHYEIPKWDGDLGASRPQVHWPLTEELVQRKFALLDEHYPSQRGHDWWRADTFAALSRLRGVECRSPHAEAFSCPALVLRPGSTG